MADKRRLQQLGAGVADLLAVLAAAALVGLGALNLYAVSGRPAAERQLLLGAVGVVALLVLRATRLGSSAILAWACYGLSILLLGGVEVVGVSANGARRWLAVGSLTFQPSELAELGLLMVMAQVLGARPGPPSLRRFAAVVLLAAVPIGITAMEPDLSTATVLTALAVAMLVVGRVPLRYLLTLIGSVALVAPLTMEVLRPYQVARLRGFFSGSPAPGGSAYSVLQSHIALASGRLLGQVHTPVHQLLAQYLPGRSNDLALASLVEQWGLVAGGAALLAAAVLVWRLALAARLSRTRPGGLLAAGLALLFGVEAVVSLGGNLGVLPLAGVPFPLLSLGGTTLVVHLTATGLALGTRRDAARRRLWAPPRWLAPRPRWVRAGALSMSGLLAFLGLYGWQFQKRNGPVLRAEAQTEVTRCVTVPAPRGVITDRHGTVLAEDVNSYQVETVPSLLAHDPNGMQRLAPLLGRTATALQDQVAAAVHDLALQLATVAPATGARIKALGIPEVWLVTAPGRVYPYGDLLGPILGYVGIATPADERRWPGLPPGEIVGRAGIELQYDPVLRGVDGRQCVYVDPAGVPRAMAGYQAPVPGDTVMLSIDLGLQEQLTADLAAGLASSGGDLGGAVAMDPRTGQVLAMASLPAYNDNIYGPPVDLAALRQLASRRGQPGLEHVTQSVAPPGSTFKLVVGSADAVYNAVPPAVVVPTGASFTLAGHTFNNWSDLGPMDLSQSIAWSNDVYFYKLAWALGPDRINRIGTQLGVGQPTGIDLPGETAGYFGTPASVQKAGGQWYAGSTVIMGIGQGYVAVTPLQDARWTGAVTTGSLVTPRLGLAVSTGAGAPTPLPGPAPQRLPFAGQLGPVQAGMAQAVTDGLASQLRNLPVPAAAKTGSAQDPGSPNGGVDSWFTAAAPFPSPAVVITSLVRGGGEGATTSGPVVDRALQYFLAHQARIEATAPGA